MKVELDLENDSLYIQMNPEETNSDQAEVVETIASVSGMRQKDVANGALLWQASKSIFSDVVARILSDEPETAPVANA